MSSVTLLPRQRILIADEFTTFKRDASCYAKGKPGHHFADGHEIIDALPTPVKFEAFSLAIFDQARFRGFSATNKPSDNCHVLSASIAIAGGDHRIQLPLLALYFLLHSAFSSKDIDLLPAPIIHVVPKPVFEEAKTDLLAVHNALSSTIGYADSMESELTRVLRALIRARTAGPEAVMELSKTPVFNEGIDFVRSYPVITEVLPLIADY